MNISAKLILAIDIPSGLDGTSGKAQGICIEATKTVTFSLPKVGVIKNDSPQYTGEVIVVDISIPKQLLNLRD